jgi:hypothetical protein
MNYILKLIILLLTISTALESEASQRTLKNLIPNPSFEFTGLDVRRETADENWLFCTDDDGVTGHTTTSRSVDGFRSYLIRAERGRGVLRSDPFKIERGGRHIFSFAISGDAEVNVSVLLWNVHSSDTLLMSEEVHDTLYLNDEWRVVEYETWVPRRAKIANVRYEVTNGSAWIDDVRFRRLP